MANPFLEKVRSFGLTTSHDVRLVTQDHPFPYLVEQEERWHGALLANTSHGVLVRLLTSLGGEPSFESGILSTFGIAPRAENMPARLDVHIQYCGRMLHDNARQVHEAVAKYLSFAAFAQRGAPVAADCTRRFDAVRRSFRLIDPLVRLGGDPTDPDNAERAIATAYHVGKVLLNTGELWALLKRVAPNELAAAFCNPECFVEVDESFEDRAAAVLAAVDPDDLVDRWKALRDVDHSDAYGVVESAYAAHVVDVVSKALIAAGMTPNPLRTSGYLFVHAALLGKRLRVVCPTLDHSIPVGNIGFSYGPDGIEIDSRCVDERGEPTFRPSIQDVSAIVDNDPSLAVYYGPAVDGAAQWLDLDPAEAERCVLEADFVLAFPVPSSGSEIECWTVVRKDRKSRYVRFKVGGMRALMSIARRMPRTFTFLLLRVSSSAPTITEDPNDTTARRLRPYGRVFVWDVVARASSLLRGTTLAYVPQEPLLVDFAFDVIASAAVAGREPLGIVRVAEQYCAISSVPSYVTKIMFGLIKKTKGGPASPGYFGFVRRIDGGLELAHPAAEHRAQDIQIATRIYDMLYRHPSFPSYLPFYDPWEMYRRIEHAA